MFVVCRVGGSFFLGELPTERGMLCLGDVIADPFVPRLMPLFSQFSVEWSDDFFVFLILEGLEIFRAGGESFCLSRGILVCNNYKSSWFYVQEI